MSKKIKSYYYIYDFPFPLPPPYIFYVALKSIFFPPFPPLLFLLLLTSINFLFFFFSLPPFLIIFLILFLLLYVASKCLSFYFYLSIFLSYHQTILTVLIRYNQNTIKNTNTKSLSHPIYSNYHIIYL